MQPDSHEAYSLIRNWYLECQEDHDSCKQKKRNEGPKRLIHILPEPSGMIRLCELGEAEPPAYVALSHCWGKVGVFKTNSDNIVDHTFAGISIASLSKTFRDAIKVCQELGEHYIWIDSLCIIQDSRDDKASEIPKMQAIYEGATLTISAMSARDGRGGCWMPRSRIFDAVLEQGNTAELAFQRLEEVLLSHAPFVELNLDTDLDMYPLATRKWALQERILSRRVLHITAQDIVWQCRAKQMCSDDMLNVCFPEWLAKSVFDALSRETPEPDELLFQWMSLIVVYSHGKLSDETDVLRALAGLARDFSGKGLGAYSAGLWTKRLATCLCWYTVALESGDREHHRPKNLAPTWSWASVQGLLGFDALNNDDEQDGNFEEVAIVLETGKDHCDVVGNQSCVLQLHTTVCTVPRVTASEDGVHEFEEAEFFFDTLSDVPLDQRCLIALMLIKEPDESQALVLTATGSGTYRRCGLLKLPDRYLDRFTEKKSLRVV